MNVLILGSGGREHAICWKLEQSPKLTNLFIAPGNAGTEQLGENVNLDNSNFTEIAAFCLEKNIEMLVVGPEDPLVNGIIDYFESDEKLSKIKLIGPSTKAAMLEGSKDFAKDFMQKYNIPTARHKTFTRKEINDAISYLNTINPPYVIKADGLAAGKGVIICEDKKTAKKTLTDMLVDKKFGKASSKVLIEEFLRGVELSVFVLTDGENYLLLPEAKDYKRIGEGDTGLNTGGMGSLSPVPFANDAFMKKVEDKIIIPTINGIKSEKLHYKGFIFFGLINSHGDPYVIEYNVRMGDPEAQSVIPRIKSDLLELFIDVANNNIKESDISFDDRAVASVILVSGGYPGSYEKGKTITGISKVMNSLVFYAGAKTQNSTLLTNGGRVLAISSFGETLNQALGTSYESVKKIHFDKMYYRKDLGFDLK